MPWHTPQFALSCDPITANLICSTELREVCSLERFATVAVAQPTYLILETNEGVNSSGVHIPRSEDRTSSQFVYLTKVHEGEGIAVDRKHTRR